jgi:hypothetical protein
MLTGRLSGPRIMPATIKFSSMVGTNGHDDVPAGDPGAAQVDVPRRVPHRGVLHRGVEAEELPDRALDQLRPLLRQPGLRIGRRRTLPTVAQTVAIATAAAVAGMAVGKLIA